MPVQGFDLQLCLRPVHEEEGEVTLCLFNQLGNKATGPTHTSVAINRKLCAQKAGDGGAYSHQYSGPRHYEFEGEGWGWDDFFKTGPVSSIEQLSEFIVDGQLRLRNTLLKVVTGAHKRCSQVRDMRGWIGEGCLPCTKE